MSELINVTIDGVSCTCEKGEYIYDVAKRNNIGIPVLCRSDAFENHRACCRICIVEVEIRGRTKVVTSCVYPIEQECIIRTNTERIHEERAVILALLGHRAPEAKLISRMSGRYDMGGFERFIEIDNEKCILCGLCVQACDSLGTGAISTVNRGTDKKVDTPYASPSLACVGCLSCANVCPTGAVSYEQDDTTRTIWNRAFDLVHCRECGQVMGTPESIRHAVGAEGEAPVVCAECRKRQLADEMMQTYRYV